MCLSAESSAGDEYCREGFCGRDMSSPFARRPTYITDHRCLIQATYV
jgi:hypothetical protein